MENLVYELAIVVALIGIYTLANLPTVVARVRGNQGYDIED